MTHPRLAIYFVSALLLCGCASTVPPAATPDADRVSYLNEKSHAINDRYFIGPQPSAEDLAELKTAGITRVISFRTPGEMDKLTFSQEARLDALGIEYSLIPVGGKSYGYTPAQMSALDDALRGEDKVLLHCGSGYRASVIMVAWLVENQGMSLDEALTHAEGWWPLPIEKVLERKVTAEFADE